MVYMNYTTYQVSVWENKMSIWNGDIETNGLLDDVTIFHCAVFNNVNTDEWKVFVRGQEKDLEKFLETAGTLVMHNGIGYDKPAMNKLGIKCNNKIIDSLSLAWYLEPTRPKYGLASYGDEAGIPKPVVEDWHDQPMSVYVNRCTEDVKIQKYLWSKQTKMLNELYSFDKDKINEVIDYFNLRMEILRLKAKTKWKLDVQGAKDLLSHLQKELAKKSTELMAVMPKQPVYKDKKRPKVYYKKDGNLSKSAEDWVEFCEENNLDVNAEVHRYIAKYKDPQPHYVPEVKQWLYSLGWQPEIFEYKRNKVTGETKANSRVTDKETKELCPDIIRMSKKHPELTALLGYSIIKHRIGFVNSMLEHVDENGYLVATVNGFTNTLRSKHSAPLANIPSIRKDYGAEIRGLLTCEDGYECIGSDMSSLEDRWKHHYQWDYDPEYVKTQMADDFDPHLLTAFSAGLINQVEMDYYKKEKKSHSDEITRIGLLRQVGKGGNYSCQYGAGATTVARTCGVEEAVGKKVHTGYWKLNWSIKAIAKATRTKKAIGQTWQMNPVNGFWYWLKTDKDRFSTLVQGSGAYSFDMWIQELILIFKERWGADLPLCGDFHDEIILRVKKGHRELFTEILKEGIHRVNRKLNLNRELDVGIDFGNDYSEIH